MSHTGPSSGSTDDNSRSPLIQAFEELSRSCLAGEDLPTVLGRVPALAVSSVRACDEASISVLGASGRLSTPYATARVLVELDAEQYRSGAGPDLSALAGEDPSAYSAEVGSDERWPVFGSFAAARGFRSVFSRRFDGGDSVAVISFYARRPDAFNDGDKATATLLAVLVGAVTALTYERTEGVHLREALQRRHVLAQAKGILIERTKVTAEKESERLHKTFDVAPLEAARVQLDLSIPDLWLRCFALGGFLSEIQLGDALLGQEQFSVPEYDIVAQALNEEFMDAGSSRRAGYTDEP